MTTAVQCVFCAHYLGALTCEAYPGGIPQPIIDGRHDHREPYPGDGGVRWAPAEGTPPRVVDGDG